MQQERESFMELIASAGYQEGGDERENLAPTFKSARQ